MASRLARIAEDDASARRCSGHSGRIDARLLCCRAGGDALSRRRCASKIYFRHDTLVMVSLSATKLSLRRYHALKSMVIPPLTRRLCFIIDITTQHNAFEFTFTFTRRHARSPIRVFATIAIAQPPRASRHDAGANICRRLPVAAGDVVRISRVTRLMTAALALTSSRSLKRFQESTGPRVRAPPDYGRRRASPIPRLYSRWRAALDMRHYCHNER